MAFNKQKALERAEKYAAKGHHDKAAREYQAVVEDDPKDVRAWLMLADCLVRCDDKPGAIDRYVRVASHYAQQKQPQKAVAVFRQVLNLDPSRWDVHLQVALLNRELGRGADAVAGFEMVGQGQLQAGRVKEALECFRMAAETDTASVSKRLRLAELCSREKMLDEAVEHFRIAANTLLDQGRLQDFVRVGERLLYHRKDDVAVLRQLAAVYLREKEPRRALMKLNALLHAVPNDVEGLELLADTFMELDKPDKAVSVVLELVRELRKHGPEARRRLVAVVDKARGWAPEHEELMQVAERVGASTATPTSTADEPSEEIEELDLEEADVVELEENEVVLEPEAGRAAEVPEEAAADPAVEQSEAVGEASVEDEPEGSSLEALEGPDKIVYEARVYLKYSLFEHALEHVQSAFDLDAQHVGAWKLRARALKGLKRAPEAAEAHLTIAQGAIESDRELAAEHVNAALALVPDHEQALALQRRLEGGAPAPAAEAPAGVAPDTAAGDIPEPQTSDEFEVEIESSAIDLEQALLSEDDLAESEPTDAFEVADERAFEELEGPDTDAKIQAPDTGIPELLDDADTAIRTAAEEDEFAIELQESEPEQGSAAPDIEDRFGLSDAAPLPSETGGGDTRSAEPSEPEGGWPDIADEVAEVQFFIDQGLEEDARFAFDDLERRHPDHPDVMKLAQALGTPEQAEAEQDEAAKPLVSLEEEDEDVDAYLEAIFSDEPAKPQPKKPVQVSAHAQVENADAGTYFDLGTAYREMGLVDDAITQFEQAAEDPRWRAKSLVMLGTLRVHRGETDQARQDLQAAIECASTPDELSEARYELGLVYAKAGDTQAAIRQLQEVPEGFRDRDERLDELRTGSETGG